MRDYRLVACVVLLAAAVSGCRGSGDLEAPNSDAAAGPTTLATAAGPDAKPGIAVTDARLILPAVAGRPAAAYFTVSNGAGAPTVLVAAAVDGAKEAQMHETSGGSMAPLAGVEVPAHGGVAFAPGGRHVMVFGLPATLRPGGSPELTLTFKGGDKISAPLAVQPAGAGASDPMAGMTMGH